MTVTDEMLQAAIEEAIRQRMLPIYLKDFLVDERREKLRKVIQAALDVNGAPKLQN